jgi:hypothetical protein
MLARDYTQLGEEKSILHRIGDGAGFPFKGPLSLRFIDASTLVVIEKEKGVSFLTVSAEGSGDGKKSSNNAPAGTFNGGSFKCNFNVDSNSSGNGSGSGSGNKGTELAEMNEAEAITFLNITATDICRVPLSKNIAISDTTEQTINFIDSKEWFQKKKMPGKYLGLVGVSCFSIGFEAFFAICDAVEQKVIIVKEGE